MTRNDITLLKGFCTDRGVAISTLDAWTYLFAKELLKDDPESHIAQMTISWFCKWLSTGKEPDSDFSKFIIHPITPEDQHLFDALCEEQDNSEFAGGNQP